MCWFVKCPYFGVCLLAGFPHSVGTYIPYKEVVVEETIRATVIKPNQAIKLRARKETLVHFTNSYIPLSSLFQYFPSQIFPAG